jgi:hypothetical protein
MDYDRRVEQRRHRAGEGIQDLCRACKAQREHTVIAAGSDGRALRVMCGFCGSQHNYRGIADDLPACPAPAATPRLRPRPEPSEPAPENERTGTPMAIDESTSDLEALLRRVIREETGLTPVAPAARWRGGSLVLRPGKPGLQEKTWPIETFFHKIVMLRNRLRTMEQQVNASELPEDEKVRLQAYLTGCYGSLTSFNVLFAEEQDQFCGAAGD